MEEINQAPPRKVIGVACTRCRKRKIKCSGDPGNSTGCHNCRRAGVEPRVCQFIRVGPVSFLPLVNAQHYASPVNGYSTNPTSADGSETAVSSRSLPVSSYNVPRTGSTYHPWIAATYPNNSGLETYTLMPHYSSHGSTNEGVQWTGGHYLISSTRQLPIPTGLPQNASAVSVAPIRSNIVGVHSVRETMDGAAHYTQQAMCWQSQNGSDAGLHGTNTGTSMPSSEYRNESINNVYTTAASAPSVESLTSSGLTAERQDFRKPSLPDELDSHKSHNTIGPLGYITSSFAN
ncbi:hypothetical protein P152DRAFT_457206 [Eremomyces bilateralis CBS 781.70]|uniref:Zn(2)-C6 fungal-type domain-containing protein n=1 Tax=Eremomyces bilateralis CBS 781.70 TaxID=1392243 RepID=A0A6G1G711_9PEZI|nr:uncharacterized protein P152DRAFT_457206 [Eremomyces bilateralis CBS 781.70]KAF1813833.1 hypothetical protein P152DRAFT_457206 [Eremomyces bilateralis CBS 781.70]